MNMTRIQVFFSWIYRIANRMNRLTLPGSASQEIAAKTLDNTKRKSTCGPLET